MCAHKFSIPLHTHTHTSTHLLVIHFSGFLPPQSPRCQTLLSVFRTILCFANHTQLLQQIPTACSISVNFCLSQVLNGHFVHYFAPKDLPAVPKNVVFVIDTSASMLGTKIRQVKQHTRWISRKLL